MRKTTAFWDASALVPLCVREAATRQAFSLLRRYAPVVWWGSFVEVQSAICRLRRDRELTDPEKQGAIARVGLLSRGWNEILPTEEVRDLALESLDARPLRAADAMQLAAALVWCQRRPARRVFICADRRLSGSPILPASRR